MIILLKVHPYIDMSFTKLDFSRCSLMITIYLLPALHVFQPCTFSMGQLFLISDMAFKLSVSYLQWQPSGQCFAWALGRVSDGDFAASATSSFPWCGFSVLGQSCHWWPLPLHCLEMSSGLKPTWETDGLLRAVGHLPQACTWASSNF